MSEAEQPADLGSCEYECYNGKWIRTNDGSIPPLSHCPEELGTCNKSGAKMVVPAFEGPAPPAESSEEKTE